MLVELLFSIAVSYVFIAAFNLNLGIIFNFAIPLIIFGLITDVSSKDFMIAMVIWSSLLISGEYVNKHFSFMEGLTGSQLVDNFLFCFGMVMGQFTK